MKNRLHMQLKIWASLSVALSLALLPRDVQAVQRPPERTVIGVVESVDPTNGSLILKTQGQTTTSLKLGIRTQTIIRSRDGKRTTSAQISPGATVEVRYRSHLLGVPQSSRVTLR